MRKIREVRVVRDSTFFGERPKAQIQDGEKVEEIC
jgi:hypothetical protein